MGKRKLPWTESKAPAKREKTDPIVTEPTVPEATVPEAHPSPWKDANCDVKLEVADVIGDRALATGTASWETLRDLYHFARTNKENAGLFNRTEVPLITFKKFKPVGQLSLLIKDLYEKVIPQDTFAEGTHVGNFWEWTGADPVKNLMTASPLFRAQSEITRSTLITDVLSLDDKVMKARCLKQMIEDPNYFDYIYDKDLKRLHSATSSLESCLSRDAPHEVDLRESVRLLQKRIDSRQDSFSDISGSPDRSSELSSSHTLSRAPVPAPASAPEKDISSTIAALKGKIDDFAFDNTNDEHHAKARSIGNALMTNFDSERSKIISGQFDRNEPKTAIGTQENDKTPAKASRSDLANTERSRDTSNLAG